VLPVVRHVRGLRHQHVVVVGVLQDLPRGGEEAGGNFFPLVPGLVQSGVALLLIGIDFPAGEGTHSGESFVRGLGELGYI
jgi:hypothetical protein